MNLLTAALLRAAADPEKALETPLIPTDGLPIPGARPPVKCPSCGLPKPRWEVRHDYYCKQSEGLETEEVPCLDCRELAKDGGSIGICDPRVEAH